MQLQRFSLQLVLELKLIIDSYNYVSYLFADMNALQMQSRKITVGNSGTVLSLSPLPATSTLLVSNLPPGVSELTLQYHFERFSGVSSVTSTKLLPPDKALVTFVNCKCKCYGMYIVTTMVNMYNILVHIYSSVPISTCGFVCTWYRCTGSDW